MFCSKCGFENQDENSFCEACGTRLFVPSSNEASYTSVIKTRPNHIAGQKKLAAKWGIISIAAAALIVAVVLILSRNQYEKTKLNGVRCDYINVADDWIYYANEYDNGFYRMRLDGAGAIKINDYEHIDINADINIVGDWIYYINDSGIYRMHTDGSEDSFLIEEQWVNNMTIADGWIYYGISQSLFDDGLYKMRINGSENVKLSDEEYIGCICIEEGWVYYVSDGIYKVRTDGSDRTKLSGETSEKIRVAEGWVYYIENSGVYKMRTDGSERTIIYDVDVRDFQVTDSWVYYSSYEDGIVRTRTDGSKKMTLCNDDPYDIIVKDGWIYYCLENYSESKDGIYRIRTGPDTIDGDGMKDAQYDK